MVFSCFKNVANIEAFRWSFWLSKNLFFWRVYRKNLTYVQSESWYLIDVSRLIHEGVSFHAYQNNYFLNWNFVQKKKLFLQSFSQHKSERIIFFLHEFERFRLNFFNMLYRKENFDALRYTGRKAFYLSEIIGLLFWQASIHCRIGMYNNF